MSIKLKILKRKGPEVEITDFNNILKNKSKSYPQNKYVPTLKTEELEKSYLKEKLI